MKTLVERAKEGDETAFAQLVEENQKRMYHLAYRMMGNHEDALDVSQEAFFKAWRALPNFKGESSFSTWLYRLTSNTAIDHLRKRKDALSLTTDFEEQDQGNEMDIEDKGVSPENALIQKEIKEEIQEGLDKLPAHHRQVLVLREMFGMSYQEISTTLALDLGTVKSRIARGRKTLREFLQKKL